MANFARDGFGGAFGSGAGEECVAWRYPVTVRAALRSFVSKRSILQRGGFVAAVVSFYVPVFLFPGVF